ncbi:MAG: hypothetical protein AAGM38_16835 [Pseudomonadota bacterium]
MAPRLVMFACFAAATALAFYMSYYGVFGESGDVARSLREGSVGGPGFGGRVK